MLRRVAVGLGLLLGVKVALGQSVITTVAGTDLIPTASGIPAINAAIGVNAVNADKAGNFYVSDEFQNVVFKIDPAGNIFVIAGNGIQTFSGDGGLAVNASLNEPQGVAVDTSGNVYISDSFNHRIRRIDAQGVITTLAGNGQPGFSGDGGPAAGASLNRPYRIALDSKGILYIVDSLNNRIRKVDTLGVITTVAGAGPGGFSGDGGPAIQALLGNPVGIAIGPDDTLYIADRDNNRIRRVDQQGVITTIAGIGQPGFSGDGGPATSAAFNQPYGLAFDSKGNLYVVDYVNDRIRRIDTSGVITTVAGNGQRGFAGDGGPAINAPLEFPFSADIDSSDRLLIADTFNNRIRRVSLGTISTAAGNGQFQNLGDNGPATSGQFNRPSGLAIDRNGVIYIADTYQYLIRRVDASGTITTVGGNGLLGYSGDGGPATQASFNAPGGVAVDSSGVLYVADTYNHRIRKISPQGTVTTIAGNGFGSYGGDGSAATSASLNQPAGIAFDAGNNLFIADTDNNRVRKVTPAGVISTVAGNGQAGYAGDGAAATAAALNGPSAVAVDNAGNLYICDTGNNRIRKVTSAGVISTVAGNGQYGFTGDGGPATSAMLANPAGIAVDSAGNVYIADTLNQRIRVVNSSQTIATIAGNGVQSFRGDGDLATLASLGAPQGVAVMSGDVFIADTRNQRIRRITAIPPSFDISVTSLTFAASSGGLATPEQGVGVSASVVGVAFTATVAPATATWLTLNIPASVTPGRLGITADPSRLAPGSYQATVTLTASNARPQTRVVSVTFNVSAAVPAKFSITPAGVSFTVTQSIRPQTQTLTVANAGGGALEFVASAAAVTGNSTWLSVSADSGSSRPGAPFVITVTADPRNLDPGTYDGEIDFASATTGEEIAIPVRLGINAIPQKIVLSQTGLTFTAVAAGGQTVPQTFSVINDGEGLMNFSVRPAVLSGSEWLSVVQDSGATDAGGNVADVNVRVDPTGLAPGVYSGQIRVDAPRASNSPQFVSVYLNLLAPGSNPGPAVQPATLQFTGAAGGPNPGSQTALVYNTVGTSLSFTSSRAFFEGKDWFVHVPSGGAARQDQPSRIVVQPNISGLAAGVYNGALNLQFSDGTVRAIGITLVLTGSPVSAAQDLKRASRFAGGCAPTTLLPAFTSLTAGFSVPAGWPASVQTRVTDDCGNPLAAGSVSASFSNGDPPLPLTSLRDGRWEATWQPRTARPGVTISIAAASADGSISGTAAVTGGLSTIATPPQVNQYGIVNSASFDGRLPTAPGSMISILGSGLSSNSGQSAGAPLPTELSGTSVLLAGKVLPLIAVSESRIDAIVPFDVPVSTQHQLIVQRGSNLTVPSPVSTAPSSPAIFTQDGSGTGQGNIFLDSALSQLAAPGHAAHAGDTVFMSATGLGVVSADIAAGNAGPSDPLAATANQVTVSIGGVSARTVFAGLMPGGVGLYQLQVSVPDGAPPGDSVPVILSVAGQTSPPVTMAIQ